MSEKKDNSGVLFRNSRKETEKHPDYTGSATIGGVEYWISAWVNESKDGKKYFAFSFKVKDEQPSLPPANDVAAPPSTPVDDLPF